MGLALLSQQSRWKARESAEALDLRPESRLSPPPTTPSTISAPALPSVPDTLLVPPPRAISATASRFRAAAMEATSKVQDQHENSGSEDEDGSESTSSSFFTPVSRSTCATIVIFGADGNLCHTRVLPTLYDLWQRHLLPRDVLVVGFARPMDGGGRLADTAAFRAFVSRCCGGAEDGFLVRCHYATGQFDDSDAVGKLLTLVRSLEATRLEERRRRGPLAHHSHAPHGDAPHGNDSTGGDGGAPHGVGGGPGAEKKSDEPRVRMYYAATPPFLYAKIAEALVENGVGQADALAGSPRALAALAGRPVLSRAGSRVGLAGVWGLGEGVEERFVFEKPFGHDTESCEQLISELSLLPARDIFWMVRVQEKNTSRTQTLL